MDFYQLVEKRRSVRHYQNTPIPRDVLERLGKAIAVAPSACNKQPCKILIITNPELLDALRTACPQQMLKDAPAVAAVVGNPYNAWRRPEGDSIIPVDAAIMMEHLILAATAEGLASCWICAYSMAKLNAALAIEAPANVYAITPLGFPSEPAAPIVRKELSEIFEIIE